MLFQQFSYTARCTIADRGLNNSSPWAMFASSTASVSIKRGRGETESVGFHDTRRYRAARRMGFHCLAVCHFLARGAVAKNRL